MTGEETLHDPVVQSALRLYASPNYARVTIARRDTAVLTGLPPDAFHLAKDESFFLDAGDARALLQNLLETLGSLDAPSPPGAHTWMSDSAASPRLLSARIASLQDAVALADGKRSFRRTCIRLAAFALVPLLLVSALLPAALGGALGARGLRFSFEPAATSLAIVSAVLSAIFVRAGQRGPTSRALYRASFSAFLALSSARSLGLLTATTASYVEPLLGTAIVAFGLWMRSLRRTLLPPSSPALNKKSPHSHEPLAVAPSWYSNCRYLRGPTWANPAALWMALAVYWNGRTEIPGEPHFVLAGHRWQIESALEGILALGASGAGKTLLMRHTLDGALRGADTRVFVYAHKRNLYSAAAARIPEREIIIAYPLDARAYVPHWSRVLSNPLAAQAFGQALVQSEAEIWDRTAALGIAALPGSMNATFGPDWGLYHFVRGSSRKHIRRLLEKTPEGQAFLDEHLHTESRVSDRPGDVLATMASYLSQLAPFALAEEEHRLAGRLYTPDDWALGRIEQRCVILGHSLRFERASNQYNNILATMHGIAAFEARIKSKVPYFWFFFDEAAEAARFHIMGQLLSNGREWSMTTFLNAQNLPALETRYGSRAAVDAMVGNCKHQLFLRQNCELTAAKASAIAGKQEFLRHQTSQSRSDTDSSSSSRGADGFPSPTTGESHSFTTQESTPQRLSQELLPPDVLMQVPDPGPKTGVSVFYRCAGLRLFTRLSWRWCLEQLPPPVPVPDEVPLDLDSLRYVPWSDADLETLLRPETPAIADPFASLRARLATGPLREHNDGNSLKETTNE